MEKPMVLVSLCERCDAQQARGRTGWMMIVLFTLPIAFVTALLDTYRGRSVHRGSLAAACLGLACLAIVWWRRPGFFVSSHPRREELQFRFPSREVARRFAEANGWQPN